MNLKDIMAIAGKPGLYKMIAQAKNGLVVENIIDHKRIQAFTSDKISTLEEISIYTESDDMPLKEVIRKIYQKLEAKPAPDLKGDNVKIKNFFNEILPEYDKERVYVSHMQKIINWYNLLLDQNLIDLEDETEKETETATEEKVVEDVKASEPEVKAKKKAVANENAEKPGGRKKKETSKENE